MIYAVRGITLLLAVSILAFFLANLSPIKPETVYRLSHPGVSEENVEKMKDYWGVNDPPVERYLGWIGGVLRGDWGESTSFRQPVLTVIGMRFQASLALMMTAWALSGLLGFAVGCVMGMFHGRWVDSIVKRIFMFCPHFLDRACAAWSVRRETRLVSIWIGGASGRTARIGYTRATYPPPDFARGNAQLSLVC
jgi:ABC-type dipeptide/oligopeptide/nickel transport system permease component